MKSNLLKSRRGSTLVLVVIGIIVLLGCAALAVDVGYMYSEKAKLQTAADAAALAGTYRLHISSDAAIARATEIAGDNGITAENTTVLPEVSSKKVSVTVTKNVGLFFARIIGHPNASISAAAVAQEAPPGGVKGLVPIGITRSNWEMVWDPDTERVDETQEFEIKIGSHTTEASAGNFHAVDFPEGSGGSGYRDYIGNGYDDLIYLGQSFDTETGNMTGPTKLGFEDRIGSCTCTDPHNCKTDCPVCSMVSDDDSDGIRCARLAIVPVLNVSSFTDLNGKKEVTVIGFAAVFITRIQGSSVYAEFVNDIITPEGRSLTDDESSGVTIVKLVD